MTEDKSGGDQLGKPSNLPMYLGPYEVWNFGTGRDYALPLMRKYWRYISALAELGVGISTGDAIQQLEQRGGWIPTLWLAPHELTFIPFIVENPFDTTMPTVEQLNRFLLTGFGIAVDRYFHPAAALELSEPSVPAGAFAEQIMRSRFRIAFPVADNAMHKHAHSKPQAPKWCRDEGLRDRIGKNKKITVMAVIDDGIPFAHHNFRDKSGRRSRVEFCWLQSVAIDKDQKSVLFGREYTRDQIEGFIEHHGDDEDTLYREAGATADTEDLGSLIDRHATHGAHMMDLATGYAPERGEDPAEEIRIIAVQLPNTIAWDTSGFGKDMYMVSAFHYIFDRADIIAAKEGYDVENLRLVINFSYGFSGGRHDGETELEAAINELVEKRRTRQKRENDPLGPSPTALVLPAGNTFLDRLHGLIYRSDFVNDAAQFYWRIQPNDRTPSYLEIWFWHGFNPHGYRIELRDPWGQLRSSFDIEIRPNTSTKPGQDPHHFGSIPNDLQREVGQISVDLHRSGARGIIPANDTNPIEDTEGKTGRWRVLIVMAPTEPENPSLPRAASGQWTVMVKRGSQARLIEQPIHCWIQRSADPESLRSGSRQSYFDDPNDVRFRYTPQGDLSEVDTDEAFVDRFGSLNGLATGSKSLIAAGYRLGAGLGSSLAGARPARYSSAGTLSHPARYSSAQTLEPGWPGKQVDCSSMSDRSRVLPGTIAAGVRSGSLSCVQGTSNAAPFVARQLAKIFVEADENTVQDAKDDNYRSLLCDSLQGAGRKDATYAAEGCHQGDKELTSARLGAVRVPPHWQPGIDTSLLLPTARGEDPACAYPGKPSDKAARTESAS